MLSETLREYIAACFTGLWVQSHEHADALAEIAQLCHAENWQLATWDVDAGLNLQGQSADADSAGANDPLAAIRAVNTLATPDGTTVIILQNFHRFLQSAEIVQALIRQIVTGKQNRTFVVILSPVVQIPVELEKLFVVLEHELPSREQLAEIARGIATEEDELSRLTGNRRLRVRTARLARPPRSWLASWFKIGGQNRVMDLVRGATIKRGVWSMLVIPVNE